MLYVGSVSRDLGHLVCKIDVQNGISLEWMGWESLYEYCIICINRQSVVVMK